MKVFNLDKFKDTATVEIGGTSYQVRGINVREYLSGDVTGKIEKAQDERQRVMAMLDVIEKMSDIPRPVLEDQTFSALSALITIMQGGDPDAKEGAGSEAKK